MHDHLFLADTGDRDEPICGLEREFDIWRKYKEQILNWMIKNDQVIYICQYLESIATTGQVLTTLMTWGWQQFESSETIGSDEEDPRSTDDKDGMKLTQGKLATFETIDNPDEFLVSLRDRYINILYEVTRHSVGGMSEVVSGYGRPSMQELREVIEQLN